MWGWMCVAVAFARGKVQRKIDLNEILLLSGVGPPGGLLDGSDDRVRRKAFTLRYACFV